MKKSDAATEPTSSRLRELTDQLQQLEGRLRLGGGPDKIDRQHQQGKLTARERIERLLDKDAYVQEIGLLVAYDQYDGKAAAAGVVTVVGRSFRYSWTRWVPARGCTGSSHGSGATTRCTG